MPYTTFLLIHLKMGLPFLQWQHIVNSEQSWLTAIQPPNQPIPILHLHVWFSFLVGVICACCYHFIDKFYWLISEHFSSTFWILTMSPKILATFSMVSCMNLQIPSLLLPEILVKIVKITSRGISCIHLKVFMKLFSLLTLPKIL